MLSGGPCDDIQVGFVFTSHEKIDFEDLKMDKYPIASFNCQTGNIKINQNEMCYGPNVGSTEKLGIALTNQGHVFAIVNDFPLPLCSHACPVTPLNHNVFFVCSFLGDCIFTLDWNLVPTINHMGTTVHHTIIPVVKDVENNKGETVHVGTTTINEVKQHSVETPKSSERASFSHDTHLTSYTGSSNSDNSNASPSKKKLKVNTSNGGKAIVVITSDMTSETILETVRSKFKDTSLIAIKDEEGYVVSDFDAFEDGCVYTAY